MAVCPVFERRSRLLAEADTRANVCSFGSGGVSCDQRGRDEGRDIFGRGGDSGDTNHLAARIPETMEGTGELPENRGWEFQLAFRDICTSRRFESLRSTELRRRSVSLSGHNCYKQ